MTGAGFVLDLSRCVGCSACVLACRLANDWPAGVIWRRVLALNLDRHAGGPTYHLSLACHHCGQPACMAACPSEAYAKRPDGVVLLDRDRCMGCRYCELACPFGAPSYDSAAGVMTKCDLCRERIDAGRRPACVVACPTEALSFSRAGCGEEESRTALGFRDPAGCAPSLDFIPPRAARRARLYRRLQEVLPK